MTDKERIDYLYNLLGQETSLRTGSKRVFPALNEIELRNYPKRKAIDKRGCGVTVVRTKRTLTTEQKADIGLENRFRLERALRNGDPLQLMPGNLFITGTLRTDNVPVDIAGHGNVSRIVQMDDSHLFDLRTDGTRRSAIYISDIEIRTGVSVSGDKFKIRIEASNYGGDVAGRLERIAIIRADAMEDSLGGGIYVNNPNEFRFRDINYLGKAGDPGTGFLLESSLASISLSLENCKVYDAAAGFVVSSDSIPGIEGLMFYKCDAVGVAAGFRIKSTAPNNVYLPPQVDLIGCHANVADYPGAIAYEFENYAQINVSGCSAYLGGEGQRGFSLETCSESKFHAPRIYNNSGAEVTGIYVGGNNVYCNFFDVTGAVGENSTLIEFSRYAAFCKVVMANDITCMNPVKIHPESQGNEVMDVYKGPTGRVLFPAIKGYEPNWVFRSANELLRTKRYPSDHPVFPDQMAVESYQQFLEAYTEDAPATYYWKIWEGQPWTGTEAGGNRDLLHLKVNVGRWESTDVLGYLGRQQIEMIMSTREGLSVIWETTGRAATSGIQVREVDGHFEVHLILSGTESVQSASLSVINAQGGAKMLPRHLWPTSVDPEIYDSETGVIGSATVPAGTLRFDSRVLNGDFKPRKIYDALGELAKTGSFSGELGTRGPDSLYSRVLYSESAKRHDLYYRDSTGQLVPLLGSKSITSPDDALHNGFYITTGVSFNPAGGSSSWLLQVVRSDSLTAGGIVQTATNPASGIQIVRHHNGSVWSDWKRVGSQLMITGASQLPDQTFGVYLKGNGLPQLLVNSGGSERELVPAPVPTASMPANIVGYNESADRLQRIPQATYVQATAELLIKNAWYIAAIRVELSKSFADKNVTNMDIDELYSRVNDLDSRVSALGG